MNSYASGMVARPLLMQQLTYVAEMLMSTQRILLTSALLFLAALFVLALGWPQLLVLAWYS